MLQCCIVCIGLIHCNMILEMKEVLVKPRMCYVWREYLKSLMQYRNWSLVSKWNYLSFQLHLHTYDTWLKNIVNEHYSRNESNNGIRFLKWFFIVSTITGNWSRQRVTDHRVSSSPRARQMHSFIPISLGRLSTSEPWVGWRNSILIDVNLWCHTFALGHLLTSGRGPF